MQREDEYMGISTDRPEAKLALSLVDLLPEDLQDVAEWHLIFIKDDTHDGRISELIKRVQAATLAAFQDLELLHL